MAKVLFTALLTCYHHTNWVITSCPLHSRWPYRHGQLDGSNMDGMVTQYYLQANFTQHCWFRLRSVIRRMKSHPHIIGRSENVWYQFCNSPYTSKQKNLHVAKDVGGYINNPSTLSTELLVCPVSTAIGHASEMPCCIQMLFPIHSIVSETHNCMVCIAFITAEVLWIIS